MRIPRHFERWRLALRMHWLRLRLVCLRQFRRSSRITILSIRFEMSAGNWMISRWKCWRRPRGMLVDGDYNTRRQNTNNAGGDQYDPVYRYRSCVAHYFYGYGAGHSIRYRSECAQDAGGA